MFYLASYIASVTLCNYAFSFAPQLDVIWSLWGGLIFILRDMVQTRYGHGSLLTMVGALIISYLTSSPEIALASTAAFALSESIDWIVFTITRRPLRDRLWISAAASIPADTLVFFWLIDAFHANVIAVSMLSKLAGVSLVWFTLQQRARAQQSSAH